MTKEEALFWFAAIIETSKIAFRAKNAQKKLLSELAGLSFTEIPDLAQITAILCQENLNSYSYYQCFPEEIILPLINLLSLSELVELMLTEQPNLSGQNFHRQIISTDGFRRFVLIYLKEPDRNALKEQLQSQLNLTRWPPAGHPPEVFFLAAMVGMHQELLTLVESWPDDTYIGKENYSAYYQKPQEIIFGLGTANLVETQIRRLKLPLTNPAYIRAWLAHTEYQALDWVCQSILAVQNKDEARKLVEAFALVKAPEAAPLMLELQQSSKAPQVAGQWLEENLIHSIQGLISIAKQGKGRGKLADAALEWLRTMKRRGHGGLIQACLDRVVETEGSAALSAQIFVEADYVLFDDQTTPDWLKQAVIDLQNSKKIKPPTWIAPTDFLPIQIGESGLNPEQMAAVILALKQSQLDKPHGLISSLKQQANSQSLDQFVWKLFERWLIEGGPSKEKWGMIALGLLGSDAIAFKLTPLIKVWPGESQHPRAVLGLQCLRAIGTDTALMQINGIAQKLKFKGLKAKAQECMEQIAQDRGLTRPQLEDRIVPDCDLNERGTRTFDFGPRQFQFVLGENMKPMVRDSAGTLKPDLPKPGVRDDADLANQAVTDWKLMKKQISDLVKIQAVRLEQAMVQGRRWPLGEFELLFVHHPLMINLVRLLLWGSYDEAGRLTQTFRVTEDQTYADTDDETLELTASSAVGIIHPLYLEPDVKNTWGEVLSDYEIVPPFPQLGRAIYTLEPGEAELTDLTRFSHLKIPTTALVGTLEKLGWTRGVPQDGGVYDLHYKQFEQAKTTAVIGYDQGIPVGYIEGWDDQSLESCYFLRGMRSPYGYWLDDRDQNILKLKHVDPVVISEVLSDLNALAAKGKNN